LTRLANCTILYINVATVCPVYLEVCVGDRSARPIGEILSKREKQAMEVIHRRGEAAAAEIYQELPDAPSYNAVRSTLRMLLEKRQVVAERRGRQYVYRPAVPTEAVRQSAVGRLIRTFFGGSTERLLTTLFEERTPSPAELDRIERLIEEARNRQRAVREHP
jgi:BlaI family transcriptional regulator, penicillinase repressor